MAPPAVLRNFRRLGRCDGGFGEAICRGDATRSRALVMPFLPGSRSNGPPVGLVAAFFVLRNRSLLETRIQYGCQREQDMEGMQDRVSSSGAPASALPGQ